MPHLSLNDERRLSRYVVPLGVEGKGGLYHTVTGRRLPVEADEQALEREFFLAGQERQALLSRLFRPRRTLVLTLIVTWECNLRCNHCTVLDKLVPEARAEVDPRRLADFVRRFREARPEIESLKLTFLGGEPLLRPDLCLETLACLREVAGEIRCDATSNLAMPLEEAHLELIRACDDLVVSLDGLESQHNAQRHPFRDDFNPFERTLANLERLGREGLNGKVLVQGAIRDEFASIELFQDFQRRLMALGVPWNRIAFETIHPTRLKPRPQQTYLATLRNPTLRTDPCCKYRGGYKLIVNDDGTLYSDYYDWEPLGTLDDPIEPMLERHRKMVLDTMPVLHDEGCRDCPAVGYCWGGCTNAHELAREPSRHCDQALLIRKIRELAVKDELPAPPVTDTCNST
ncbi:MAG: radical SAM protein [Acidobacteriota bacterium]|nr:radical SAM protein [Acidobacteriota bacterium]MDQ7087794.1 radical SAM protein [Acidobacteriota bacterium]